MRRAIAPAAALLLLLPLTGCGPLITAGQATLEQQRDRADSLGVLADLSSAKVAMLTLLVTDPGATPTIDDLADAGYTPSDNVASIRVARVAGGDFCLEATDEAGTAYHATESEPAAEGACD